MTRKITISVPDALHKGMEKWKKSFNFSRVFQEAMSQAIERKEAFQRRMTEETSIDEIIERLRDEKTVLFDEAHHFGKLEGLRWAKAAHYQDLQTALRWIEDNEDYGNVTYPKRDVGTLSYYFASLRNEYPLLGVDERDDPNDFTVSFIEGWQEAVNSFWEEVQERLKGLKD